MELRLPYPPSINHYYRQWQGRTLISKAGREFKLRVVSIVRGTPGLVRIEGRGGIVVETWMPDRKERDLDNLMKPLLDALQAAGLCRKDTQFRDQRIFEAGLARPHGYLRVTIWPLAEISPVHGKPLDEPKARR